MAVGGPTGKLLPVEKNIVLFWSMMWYIFTYSRLLRQRSPLSWMFGKTGSGWFLKAGVLGSAYRGNQAARIVSTGN
jgi:hypothetical protein